MFRQSFRFAILAGALISTTGLSVRADDCCGAAAPAASCCTRKVTCTEWVPETYETTRTTYRTECRQESYTAYRCESVPETRTRTFTVNKQVPETRTETRTVCVSVPTIEERTEMVSKSICTPVTTMARRCVDRGHFECREVPCKESCFKQMCGKFSHKKDCCDECAPACPPPTKTVKVWVPCMVTEEYPVTTMKRECIQVPVTRKVTVYKQESRQESFQVTSYKCVSEQRSENYTVNVSRQVAYQATRNVSVSVPVQEKVTCTRMVARTIEKEVPACDAGACCTTSCKPSCKKHFHKKCDACCN